MDLVTAEGPITPAEFMTLENSIRDFMTADMSAHPTSEDSPLPAYVKSIPYIKTRRIATGALEPANFNLWMGEQRAFELYDTNKSGSVALCEVVYVDAQRRCFNIHGNEISEEDWIQGQLQNGKLQTLLSGDLVAANAASERETRRLGKRDVSRQSRQNEVMTDRVLASEYAHKRNKLGQNMASISIALAWEHFYEGFITVGADDINEGLAHDDCKSDWENETIVTAIVWCGTIGILLIYFFLLKLPELRKAERSKDIQRSPLTAHKGNGLDVVTEGDASAVAADETNTSVELQADPASSDHACAGPNKEPDSAMVLSI